MCRKIFTVQEEQAQRTNTMELERERIVCGFRLSAVAAIHITSMQTVDSGRLTR